MEHEVRASVRRAMIRSISSRFFLVAALGVVCATACTGRTVSAQTVLARALDAESGSPVVGALAHLLDSDGSTIQSTLTDDLGRALFGNVPQGRYSVRAEMIGHASAESGWIDVREGAAAQTELQMERRAVLLEGIEVSADSRCRIRPEEGLTIGRVWDEARKALEAASFTDRSGVYRYRTVLYEQDLDQDARRVLEERQSSREATLRAPFASLPADELLENGFVQPEADGGRVYYAPDANVLLSDAFLDAYCFRLREGDGESEGLLGLSFEPVDGRDRRVVDITGTLWVDPGTAELEWLEYRYIDVFPEIRSDLIGGRVEFQRLPEGNWIVPAWWIRMPRLARERPTVGASTTRIAGFRVTGGRVMEATNTAGAAMLRGREGAVEGFVQDSLGVLPLSGVRVGVVGSNQQVFTDQEGRFRITGLGAGTYTIRFVDDRLESLGLEPEPVEQDVNRREVATLYYRMPAISELLFEACRSEAPPEGTSVLTGRVLDEASGGGLEGATVRVTWEEFRMSPRGPDRRITGAAIDGLETVTDEDGRYRLCAVPEERLLRLSTTFEGRESRPDTLRIPAFAGARVLDLDWPL